jgi:diacylglycerol kinase family enzyme
VQASIAICGDFDVALDAPVSTLDTDHAAVRPKPRKVRAVINLSAGTALGLSPDAVREAVETVFRAHGHDIEVACLPPDQIDAAIRDAAASDIDVLVVGGGDGTIRTAARYLMDTDKALGILPLGTMNRLAKDLEIPLDVAQAAEYLATASPSKIDVAKVNGSIFLCNSVMGTTLRYSVSRARLRGKPVTERLPKYVSAIREVLSSRQKISIAVDDGEERMRIRALSVVVTNNGYDETTPWLRRPKLDGGQLTMYVSRHRSGWGMAKAVVRAILGLWDGDPEMAKLTGSEFVIHSPKRRKRLANDGEIAKFDTPLRYEICPRALTVLTKDPAG